MDNVAFHLKNHTVISLISTIVNPLSKSLIKNSKIFNKIYFPTKTNNTKLLNCYKNILTILFINIFILSLKAIQFKCWIFSTKNIKDWLNKVKIIQAILLLKLMFTYKYFSYYRQQKNFHMKALNLKLQGTHYSFLSSIWLVTLKLNLFQNYYIVTNVNLK